MARVSFIGKNSMISLILLSTLHNNFKLSKSRLLVVLLAPLVIAYNFSNALTFLDDLKDSNPRNKGGRDQSERFERDLFFDYGIPFIYMFGYICFCFK